MKRKQNYRRGGGFGDTAMEWGSKIALAWLGGYLARGIVKVVVDTKTWQEKASPWIKKTYNDAEDLRDEAIDSVKGVINKNKKIKR